MLDNRYFEQYKSLEFIVKQLVEGIMTGLHKSPFHGFSVEFAEDVPYNNGESIRNIDWKLYARTDKLFVKRYEEETNLRACILLDHSSSMYYPPDFDPTIEHPNKMFFSIYVAACLSYLLHLQRDAVGLALFSDKLDLYTPIRSSYEHLKYLYTEYEKLIVNFSLKDKKRSNVAQCIHLAAEKTHKRSLFIVISDMFDNYANDDEEMFSALQHLKYNKNEVIIFNVLDDKDETLLDFPDKPTRFIDMETNEELKINPRAVRKEYVAFQQQRKKEIRQRCMQYGIDFEDVDINSGFSAAMLAFLYKRRRMM